MKTLDLATAPVSLFWYWMNERHRIFLRRQNGAPKPWTDDPILRDYKFTNPFRENDRGTVWLRENFLEPHAKTTHSFLCVTRSKNAPEAECDCGMLSHDLGLLAGNIAWYRMFNWWGTGEYLGWQTKWDTSQIMFQLEDELKKGNQVFTGAHIVYSTPGMSKIECITDVCADLWRLCTAIYPEIGSPVVALARESRSLEKVFELLQTVPCVGGFMAYEMVTDMRHTRLLEDAHDIYTWANPGPGALRGLHRLGLPYKPRAAAIRSIRELQDRLQLALDIPFGNNDPIEVLRGTRIEMRDIEHSLCEFDKYCRVKFGEGQPRAKFNGRS